MSDAVAISPLQLERERVVAERFKKPSIDGTFQGRMNEAACRTLEVVRDAMRNLPQVDEDWAGRPWTLSFVDSDEVTAIAASRSLGDHIVLTKGLVASSFGLAVRMCATSSFMRQIGDARNESATFGLDYVDFPVTEAEYEARGSRHIRFPKCRVRNDLAWYLGSEILALAALHEFGHIYYGHTDIVGVDLGSLCGASPSSSLAPGSRVPRAVLEFEADSFAIGARSGTVSNVRPISEEEFKRLGSPPMGKEQLGLMLTAIASAMLFRILDDGDEPSAALDLNTHPPVGVRGLSMLDGVVGAMKVNGADETAIDEFKIAMLVRVMDVEMAFMMLRPDFDPKDYVENFSQRIEPLRNALRSERDKWLAELERVRRAAWQRHRFQS